jgi:DNA polymerase III delta subunit
LITKAKINSYDIKEFIAPELEESIFQVIDDILNKNIVGSLSKIKTILNDTNIYAFYNNLLANLRTSVYISKLKNLKTPTFEISNALNL